MRNITDGIPGGNVDHGWRGGASTQRKPLFLFLFSGSFLFRLVARRFLDLLL